MAGGPKEKPHYGYFALPGLQTSGRKDPLATMLETYVIAGKRRAMSQTKTVQNGAPDRTIVEIIAERLLVSHVGALNFSS